jgi:hypothetical protein
MPALSTRTSGPKRSAVSAAAIGERIRLCVHKYKTEAGARSAPVTAQPRACSAQTKVNSRRAVS